MDLTFNQIMSAILKTHLKNITQDSILMEDLFKRKGY